MSDKQAEDAPDNTMQAAREPFMTLIRELVRTYQAFESYAMPDIRSHGFNPAEFDVLVTLGNTSGMTLTELGDSTLLFKTTLTSVVDRLQKKGLVERIPCDTDRRRTYARLTEAGEHRFEEVFPAHIAHLKKRVGRIPKRERDRLVRALREVRSYLDG
ncbi:DNA-binding MarR family transcriptional regulator [Natronospira proteinivora]|uniref:DNA-binding MarR family transcriptional regulator n=1 Tax=Natronospira proteinivora TaxID=1807133 RepID=A0ABT1G9B8_9GAMM|nr:MarR family transcriptional regulator [Natronospira proteinivora]MCP1727924.1 DNA-binding MarR family transcriptional regulator [Natronospira proteinivora]